MHSACLVGVIAPSVADLSDRVQPVAYVYLKCSFGVCVFAYQGLYISEQVGLYSYAVERKELVFCLLVLFVLLFACLYG